MTVRMTGQGIRYGEGLFLLSYPFLGVEYLKHVGASARRDMLIVHDFPV